MPQINTTQVSAPIDTTDIADTYATHKSWRGQGGWSEVADITARNDITDDRRHQGMCVWVVSESKPYVLSTGITNSDWAELVSSSGDDSLQYIGQTYKNEASLFFDRVLIAPSNTENYIPISSLTSTPSGATAVNTVIPVSSAQVNIASAYVFKIASDLLITELKRGYIDSGIWTDKIWCYVSDNTYQTELLQVVCKAIGISGLDGDILTTTGSGTTRTLYSTASGIYKEVSFLPSDANADPLLASYIQIYKGLYQIIGYTSATQVTISTPIGYINESGINFALHRNLFTLNTGNISNTTLKAVTSFGVVKPAVSLNQTNSLSIVVVGRTTSPTTVNINFYYNGNTTYSHVDAPKVYDIKSFIVSAETTTAAGGRQPNRLKNGETFGYNFYIPEDCREIKNIALLFFPQYTSLSQSYSLTANYTNSKYGSVTEYIATKNVTTPIFSSNINRIYFEDIITSAKRGTNGTLVVMNNGTGNINVLGIELLYR